MWELPPDVRWELDRSHDGRVRVDVLSRGETVAENVPVLDGSVTETWSLGLRSTLDLSVPPTAEWLDWVTLPKLELKVWSGLSWGWSEYLVPLGVFMVDPPSRSLPVGEISLHGRDRWQRIAQNDLLYKWPGPGGWATAVAARLMSEGWLGDVNVDVERDTLADPKMWEGKRHTLIADYLEPIGADAFVDREGRACIRTRKTQPGRGLAHGENGTLVKVSTTVSLDGVYNAVGAASSKSDVMIIDPAFVSITDPAHPAHQDKIGRRQTLVTSDLITDYGSAFNYAVTQLAKLSAPALGWSVECVPDPTRMPGDLIPVTCQLGSVTAAVQSVTHPLLVDADGKTQKVTLGAVL